MPDHSPIDQLWIRDYCDTLLKVAGTMPANGLMREAIVSRVQHVTDLVEAWQKRNEPKA